MGIMFLMDNRKCDDDKHKIEIDTYAANVVKDIFRMKLQGMIRMP